MSDYEERKQARIDRYRERAEQARQESKELSRESISMLEHIPPGQQCVDDLLLTAPEGVIAEILLQNILLCHSRSPLFPAKHTPGAALRGMCVPLGSFLQVGHLKPAPRPSGALPACQFKKSFRFLEREG